MSRVAKSSIVYTDFSLNAGIDGTEIVSDHDVIKQEIMHVLGTTQGTRLGRKNFGCNIRRYLFDPLSEVRAYHIQTEIRLSLRAPDNYINGVTISTIEVIPDYENMSYYVAIKFLDSNNFASTVDFNLLKKAA